MSDATVARIVDHAGGNAFYLEELVRAVADGHEELPPTVLAMVQARLGALDAETRRVLRAASVFGSTFWRAGVTALLGEGVGERHVAAQLEELTRRELVAPREPGRFADEHVFRHAIGARGGLRHAHAGRPEPRARARPARGSRPPARRTRWPWPSSSSAAGPRRGRWRGTSARRRRRSEGNDFASAIAARASRHRLRGERRAARRAARHRGRGAPLAGRVRRGRAVPPTRRWRSCLPGSPRWYETASELVSARVRLGRLEGLDALVAQLGDESIGAGEGGARVVAWARAAVSLVFAGLDALAGGLFDRIDRAAVDPADRTAEGRVHQARATRALVAGDLSTYLEHTSASAAAFELAGDARTACVQRGNAGYALGMLGAYAEAEAALRESLVTAERMGLTSAAAIARQNLGLTLAHRGTLQEARAVEERAIEATRLSGEAVMTACSHAYLAEILILARNYEAAERAALEALAVVGDREHEVQGARERDAGPRAPRAAPRAGGARRVGEGAREPLAERELRRGGDGAPRAGRSAPRRGAGGGSDGGHPRRARAAPRERGEDRLGGAEEELPREGRGQRADVAAGRRVAGGYLSGWFTTARRPAPWDLPRGTRCRASVSNASRPRRRCR